MIKYDPLRNALDYSGSEMMYTQHRGVARRWVERRLRGIARRTP